MFLIKNMYLIENIPNEVVINEIFTRLDSFKCCFGVATQLQGSSPFW